MTGRMKTMIQTGWRQLRGGAALAARLPGAIGVSGGAEFLRRGVANLVFPPCCVSCDAELDAEVAPTSDASLCEACLEQMELFAGPMCGRCGAPVPFAEADTAPSPQRSPRRSGRVGCYRCRGRKMWFDETIALGLYSGRLRELLLRMKQAEGDALSLAMGRLIWQMRGERLAAIGADVVAPIPLHWRRRVVHRTNSAAVLAEVLSAKLRVPLADGLLRRTRYTHRQFDITPPERWKNVRKAFCRASGLSFKGCPRAVV